jgi:hypothetical protein
MQLKRMWERRLLRIYNLARGETICVVLSPIRTGASANHIDETQGG